MATWVIVMTTIGLTACGGKEVFVPDAGAIPIPTLQTAPSDLSRSPQLQALVPRETAGIAPSSTPAAVEALPGALAALQASTDKPTELTRVYISGDTVIFDYEKDGVNGRSVSAVYRAGDDLVVSEPSFDDEVTFPLASVDPSVLPELVKGIIARVPEAVVANVALDVAQSNGFGLVWNIEVDDARGSLATVYADLDGTVVAVDEAS
ncbi:MAG: hypothetical protein JWN39_2164 [Ilumatobacteraceae bacterium]|nr:hypothetical protein [Ilumatobacteraceae bacterium]